MFSTTQISVFLMLDMGAKYVVLSILFEVEFIVGVWGDAVL